MFMMRVSGLGYQTMDPKLENQIKLNTHLLTLILADRSTSTPGTTSSRLVSNGASGITRSLVQCSEVPVVVDTPCLISDFWCGLVLGVISEDWPLTIEG